MGKKEEHQGDRLATVRLVVPFLKQGNAEQMFSLGYTGFEVTEGHADGRSGSAECTGVRSGEELEPEIRMWQSISACIYIHGSLYIRRAVGAADV